MEDLKFDSEKWKERLRGKSPEEIAEIVGSYYEEQYGKDRAFLPGKIICLVFFAVVIILVLTTFLRLFSHLSS